MGVVLGCGGHCEECAANCGRAPGSGCLSAHPNKPVAHTLSVAQDGLDIPLSAPQRYNLAGIDCPIAQAVCSDYELRPGHGADDGLFEDAARSFAELSDQVLPFPDCVSAGRGTDVPNLGQRKAIAALEDECRFNAGAVQKVRLLSNAYDHWRSVRGDGNCYYRTVAFGVLESLACAGEWQRLEKVVATLREVDYEEGSDEQRAHAQLLRRLSSRDDLLQLEAWVAQDAELDQALIRACRRLARLFLVRNGDRQSPSGATYAELVHAESYAGVEDYCASVVDPMGRDAETLACYALPLMLGVGVRTWILDRRDAVDLVSWDALGPGGEVDVHVLFKPGHYDLLYPRAGRDRGGREFEVLEDPVPACFLPEPRPGPCSVARAGPAMPSAAPANTPRSLVGEALGWLTRGPFPL
ncbi:unnamed protein product [Prorocentrum cordatum]|uniref:ubiquitinyl hydrolase 1 n=1 Tax=Prorocentrum cordatum TaxID=2364126 RepID=A0ABN9Q3K5_9DINO|nr:unnamed protein product [Polarella glacialis]